jgi:hypothetical protein
MQLHALKQQSLNDVWLLLLNSALKANLSDMMGFLTKVNVELTCRS